MICYPILSAQSSIRLLTLLRAGSHLRSPSIWQGDHIPVRLPLTGLYLEDKPTWIHLPWPHDGFGNRTAIWSVVFANDSR